MTNLAIELLVLTVVLVNFGAILTAVRIAPKFTKTTVKTSSSIARLVIRLPSLNLYENSITTI